MDVAISILLICFVDFHLWSMIIFPKRFKHLGSDAFGIQASALAKKLGFPLDRIFIDTEGDDVNAHFATTLLPFTRRIVIFKGLLEKFSLHTAVAVVGHELGHWYLMHYHKFFALIILPVIASAALCTWLAFKPGIYTALGFEVPQQKPSEEAPQTSPASSEAIPKKSTSKFKSWLMPYFVAVTVLNYYERPLAFLMNRSVALIHMHEHEADRFSAGLTSNKDVIDMVYELQKYSMAKFLPGVGDKLVDYLTISHPATVNRAKAIEEL